MPILRHFLHFRPADPLLYETLVVLGGLCTRKWVLIRSLLSLRVLFQGQGAQNPLFPLFSSFHQVCEDNDVRKKMWHSVMHHNIVHKERARSRLPSLHDVGICALGALQDGLVVEKVNKIVPLSV